MLGANYNQPLGYDSTKMCRWLSNGYIEEKTGEGLCVCVGPNPRQLVIGSIQFVPTSQYGKRSLANDSSSALQQHRGN